MPSNTTVARTLLSDGGMNRFLLAQLLFCLFPVISCAGGSEMSLDERLESAPVDCGTLTLNLLTDVCPPQAGASVACFQNAVDQKTVGAHLGVSAPSDEGDQLFTHLFVEPAGVSSLFDTRNDNWGPNQVTTARCNAVRCIGQCGLPVAVDCSSSSRTE
jgi:hypothetical protein